MTDRILTLRELNRATLARQLLLERASLSTLDALTHLVGLQAQLPNPPYIGLWTRLQSFQRDELSKLVERKQVVRATMMRSTLHLVTTEDYLLLRQALQPALTRALYAFFAKQAKGVDIEPFIIAARTYLQEQPRTFAQIRSKLTELFPNVDAAFMAYAVRTHLPLVQIPPSGMWGFTGNPAHALAESWLERPLAASTEGFRLLILRYLAAFGPATVKDMQTWSGFIRLQEAVEALKPELCTFKDEQGNELFDLPNRPLPPASVTAPPRFLPEYDNLILSHADRRRFISEEYRPLVFLSAGRIQATILVDGFVCGTWKIERTTSLTRLIITPFQPLAAEVHHDLLEEGERLVRFVEEHPKKVEVQVVMNSK